MGKDLQQGKKDQIDQYLKDTNEFRAKLTMVRDFDSNIGSIYAASTDNLSPIGGIRDWALVRISPQRIEGCNVNERIFNKVGIYMPI